jgi:branched-chain amino acid transport system substrate-binding protein
MKKVIGVVLSGLVLSIAGCQNLWADAGVIRIGINLSTTGMFGLAGQHSKNAAELVSQDIEAAGGIEVGGKKYQVEFVYADNESKPETAASLAVKLITKENVIGIVGGLSSNQAIPMGQMAQAFTTPMVSPWSTSPITTLDRPYVFRSCFVFTIQGPAITKFAASEFKATKAAVLFDIVSPYPRGMAKNFKDAFEAQNGVGSVVAYEEFRTGDKDFSKQLARIKDSGAAFIFSPQHYNEVPLIVRQAKSMGLTMPVVGSNSWAGGDLIGECGSDCDGLFFGGNYAPGKATGLNKEFVDAYKTAYGENPDEPAALTWDAVRVLVEAIRRTGGLSGNLVNDRTLVKDSLVKIQDFDGAAGKLSYNETGNPSKCTVIVKIENGVFTFHNSICP